MMMTAFSNWSDIVQLCIFFYKTCHSTSISKGFRTPQEAQCDILDMSQSDMDELNFLYRHHFRAAIFLCTNKQVLETMASWPLPRFARCLRFFRRHQHDF